MELKTSILKVGGSTYVKIPPSMVEYFGIGERNKPLECKIDDKTKNTALITFPVW